MAKLLKLRKHTYDWDAVVEAYLRLKSYKKVAKEIGMSPAGVGAIIKRTGTPLSSVLDHSASHLATLQLPADHPRRLVRNPEYMRDLYVDKQMTTQQIADILGLNKDTVRTGLIQCGIRMRKHGELRKGIPRSNMKGALSPVWKGGATAFNNQVRSQLHMAFVYPVMKRDGFKCVWCGSKENITVHHIRHLKHIIAEVQARLGDIPRAELIDAIVAEHTLEDGITLCQKCHLAHHKEHGF